MCENNQAQEQNAWNIQMWFEALKVITEISNISFPEE